MYTAFMTVINMRHDLTRSQRRDLAFRALCILLEFAGHPSEFVPAIVHSAAPLAERAEHASQKLLEDLFPEEKRSWDKLFMDVKARREVMAMRMEHQAMLQPMAAPAASGAGAAPPPPPRHGPTASVEMTFEDFVDSDSDNSGGDDPTAALDAATAAKMLAV